MPATGASFHSFVRAVHRRFVFLHTLEGTGIGVLCGCAAALPLVLILLWRSQPELPLALSALGLGAWAGLMWGVTRRPTRLEAAMEADRQLGLADLLGTARMVAGRDADPWVGAVLAEADARCRQLAPAAVI